MNHLRDSLSQMVQGQKPSPAQLRLAVDDLLDPDGRFCDGQNG